MVAIDTKFLTLMLGLKARPSRKDPSPEAIERLEDRIEKLLEDLDSESERIIIPTPVLAEFLIFVGKDSSAYLEKLAGMRNILIRPFDEMAAIDLAAVEVEDRSRGDKRGGSSADWAKVRFDRQIVHIARTNRAKRIYSDDKDLARFAIKLGIEVVTMADLPLPAAKQIDIEYDSGEDRS